MKKIYLILFLIGLLVCPGCEDQLDRFPKDRLSIETYFKNETECQLYTNAYYTLLPGNGIYEGVDDVVVQLSLPDEMTGTRVVQGKDAAWSWNKLRDINFFLENAQNCPDHAVRLKYMGISRFFRAYFYFEKVKRYGDVPWYNRALGSDDKELYKARDSRQLIMDSVLQDIDFAIRTLPTNKDSYQVTRWAALALKSRLCLFEGTFRKYHGIEGYEKFLEEAVSASSLFISESPHKLYTTGSLPYRDLFASLNARDEMILAHRYSSTIPIMHNLNYYINSTTSGRPGLTKKFVDTYLMKDGSRFTDKANYKTLNFYDECQNRDPRMAQTMRTPGYTRLGSTIKKAPDFTSCISGYQIIKYVMEEKYDEYNKSCVDLPIFRVAEVYLNFAEAKAELETLTQDDLNISIKKIRDRVSMPNLDMAAANANPDPYLLSDVTGYLKISGANKGVIAEIRRERTIELVMEGFRYYDLMRWREGKVLEQPFLGMYIPGIGVYDLDKDGVNDICVYRTTKPSNSRGTTLLRLGENISLTGEDDKGNILLHEKYVRTWREERDYLYPIPTNERILTQGALSQNPNWDDGLNF